MKLPSFAEGHKICAGLSKPSCITGYSVLDSTENMQGPSQEVKPCQVHQYNTVTPLKHRTPHKHSSVGCGSKTYQVRSSELIKVVTAFKREQVL